MKYQPVHKSFRTMTETEMENTFREAEKARRLESLMCAIAALGLLCGFFANVLAHFGR